MQHNSPKTHAEYMRLWRLKNPRYAEYQKEYQNAYLADPKNQQKARQRAREYYYRNKEKVKRQNLAHYHATKQLKGYATGDRNPNWKGDDVGYHGLHKWIQAQRGRPTKCEHCGLEDPDHPKRFQWANKSHEYKRDISDWIRLCTKCHFAYDQEERQRGPHGELL